MDAVQADGVRVRLPRDLVVLAGQVLHAAHLAPELVDVADLAHPPNALLVTSSILQTWFKI